MLQNNGVMLRNVTVFLGKRNMKLYGVSRGERVKKECKVFKVMILRKKYEWRPKWTIVYYVLQ